MKYILNIGLILPLALVFSFTSISFSNTKLKGWEIDSEYNQLYDPDAVEKLKVIVKDVIEVVPMPGMAEGVGLVVEDRDDGELYTVHISPAGYKSKRALGIRKRDKLTLRGCFVDIGEEEVIMASKIKVGGKTIKVRLTSDGKPFWTMPPDELKRELSLAE